MKIKKGIIIGLIFGLGLSIFTSIIIMMFALGFAEGGITFLFRGNVLYSTTIIFFILTSTLLGFYFTKQENTTNRKHEIFGLLSKLSASLFCIAIILILVEQGLTSGVKFLYGEGWLYFATIVPFALTFSVLGFYFTKRKNVSNKKLWLLSLMSALFITLYSGTIGALFGEFVVRGGSLRTYTEGGYTGVNVEGVLVWGTIYAFILLPITVPLARLIIQVFFELLKKYKIV
ncbi:hypothetical protein [Niallia oryzisoli]|uniref:hypothetical protein n=1 Tax=Niallia oryzisoli TaxID=1737571 RepID=UPI0037351BC6